MFLFIGVMVEALGFKLNPEMMKRVSGFVVIWLCKMLGTMNVKVTKEQLLGLNAMLNTIKK